MSELRLPSGHIALIDDADLECVAKFAWHIHDSSRKHGTLYVRCEVGGRLHKRRIFLHRFIMEAEAGVSVDHINGDGLDNRRANLRCCSHAENLRNRRITHGRQFKGVIRRPRSNGFEARVGGKYAGYFKTEIEAAKAYDTAAKQMYGEFCRLNFPDDA